jgi:hypothetical protein
MLPEVVVGLGGPCRGRVLAIWWWSRPTLPCVRCASTTGPERVREVVLAVTVEDEPGALGRYRRRLADASIDLDAVHRPPQEGWDPARRPKMKYEIGTTPTEPTTTTIAARTHLGPRIRVAGRRLMSMRAATLRIPSATAAMARILRVRC